jgi:hypothetical protein
MIEHMRLASRLVREAIWTVNSRCSLRLSYLVFFQYSQQERLFQPLFNLLSIADGSLIELTGLGMLVGTPVA